MRANLLESDTLRSAWNPKVACAIALSLVFLCGAAAGALAFDIGIHSRRAPAFESVQGKSATFERIRKELDLTPEQSAQMESILNDFWQYYRTVLSDSKQRIEQVLNPEQKAKFERLLQDANK